MNAVRLTTAQAVIRFLANQYVERDGLEQRFLAGMFGIFGHGNVTGIGQALEEYSSDLRYYQPKNEQAMVHTAAAYAKARNRLQTFACTSSVGPGATNMVTGAAGATINRLPVLLLPGDTFASRGPHPVLQQLESSAGPDLTVNDCFRPVSRYWDRINRPEQVLSSLPEAMRVLTDQAETGAVTISLPEDVQTEGYDYPAHFFAKRVHRIQRPEPPESEIAEAVRMIRAAGSPLIICGGGVIYSEAMDALDGLTRGLGIPACETQAGKGALPWDHQWNVGPIGANGGLAANRLAATADLVIHIGTRMSDFTTASRSAFQNPQVRFIGINVVPQDASKLASFPLTGDARAILKKVTRVLVESGYHTDSSYQSVVQELKREWDEAVDRLRHQTADGPLTQAGVIGLVNDFSAPRDVVVCAAGGLPGDLLKLWRTRDPKGYHLEYGYSCMGYEIAGGLGVKMACPDREVYVLVGDGSYLMLCNEILTSLQERYKLTLVLLDNQGFQCIRALQESTGSPAFGNERRYRDDRTGRLDGPTMPVDFAKNAESLGAVAFYADSRQSLVGALQQARDQLNTALISVPVDPESRVPSFESWWDVPVARASSQTSVMAALSSYQEAKRKQKLYY